MSIYNLPAVAFRISGRYSEVMKSRMRSGRLNASISWEITMSAALSSSPMVSRVHTKPADI